MKKTCILFAILMLSATSAFSQTLINGAGASFPYPLYSKWFAEYRKVNSSVLVNYQSVGSGAGIKQVSDGIVDFGATDGPMTDEQLQNSKVRVLHFPTVLGAVVPVYHLPGDPVLNFTPEALAGIYLGTVTRWNDPVIANANPGIRLPGAGIAVVHRSDGSGTTYCWTDYLSKVSEIWRTKVGRGTAVNWPVGLGGKGNEGVAGLVQQVPNSFGYVELIYAIQNHISYGLVQNKSGRFVKASIESVTEAAGAVAKNMPDDFRVSITNGNGKGVYPISTFTWLLIPVQIKDQIKGQGLAGFLRWMLKDGQRFAAPLSYAPLPKEVVDKEEKAISKIRAGQ